LIVAKQRHGEYDGQFKLWFHNDSLQMLESDHSKPHIVDIGDFTEPEVQF